MTKKLFVLLLLYFVLSTVHALVLPPTLYEVRYMLDPVELLRLVQTGEIVYVNEGVNAYYKGLYALPPYYEYPDKFVVPVWIVPKTTQEVLCTSEIKFNAPKVEGTCPETVRNCPHCILSDCTVKITKPCTLLNNGIIQLDLVYRVKVPISIDAKYENGTLTIYYRTPEYYDVENIVLTGMDIGVVSGVKCFKALTKVRTDTCAYPILSIEGDVWYHDRYSKICSPVEMDPKLCIVDGIILYDEPLRITPVYFGNKGILFVGEEIPVNDIDRFLLRLKGIWYKYVVNNEYMTLVKLYGELVQSLAKLGKDAAEGKLSGLEYIKLLGVLLLVLAPWIILYIIVKILSEVLAPIRFVLKIVLEIVRRIPWWVWVVLLIILILLSYG